jgi:hypothetical protein
LDDYLDTLSTSNRHLRVLLAENPSLRARIEKRLGACCDSVDAGEETMYRLSVEKLLAILVKKAERMCERGFPSSMEDRFIKPPLEIPVMSVRREETNISIASETATAITTESQDQLSIVLVEAESQASTTTTTTTTTTVESQTTVATTPDEEDPTPAPQLTTPPGVPALLRLRTALTYILNAYIPRTLHTPLLTLLSSASTSLPSFTTLDTHLAALAKLKAEALALRSISDNISRKRSYEDDEEKVAEREEKKRKKEEEDKRKKSENRSIKQLKKVDTSGMKKLSSFFTRAPAKKA